MSTLPSLPVRVNASLPALPEPIAPEYLSPGMSLTQVRSIARAYWRTTATISVLLILLVVVVLKLLPKTYTARATLMVNYELNQGGKEFPIGAVGSYMATQVEFIGSDRVLQPVIDSQKLVLDRDFTAGFTGGDAAARREWVLNNLRDSLTITQGHGSQLLYVEVAASEPVKAARIANAIAEAYLVEERRLVNEPASERAREYSAQLIELQAKVSAAQERVTDFRKRSGLSDIAGRADSDAQTLSALEQQLTTVQSSRRAAESRASADLTVSDEVLSSPTIQNLKRELAEQQSQLAQLRTTLGPRHPRLLELQSQMAMTRAALAHEVRTYTQASSTEIVAGRQLEQSLEGVIDRQRAKVLTVRQLQDEGAKLLLELESAQAVYKRALDGYDQIMFASDGKLTNVSLMSRAVPAVVPERPKKLKYLLVGIVGAVLVGLLAPLAYEIWLNRRIRCRDDLERDFGMPVFAEFDRLADEHRQP